MSFNLTATDSNVIPPGKYFVGDPCYMFGDDWVDLLNSTGYFQDGRVFSDPDKGVIWAHGTAHGDGCFNNQYGNQFSVDSGLLGVADMRFCSKENVVDLEKLGVIVHITKPSSVAESNGAFLMLGSDIDTDSQDEWESSDSEEVDWESSNCEWDSSDC